MALIGQSPTSSTYSLSVYERRGSLIYTLAISAYVLPNDEKAIRREIMKNGPVQAAYFTYEDFKLYDGGIYVQKAGSGTGGHAVKIIGWGEDKGVKYWLNANSWNVNWAAQGYFRMIRGINNCSLEEMVYAGMMKVD
ncbi:hypothetical protein RB195_007658 [Necator americanus]|uniref:Peptidase C1A papain C-terminal domain-containing protein n=1 Tax=Necator americanus TaxID=51031 RepID=A0ABR1BZG1_NECAM